MEYKSQLKEAEMTKQEHDDWIAGVRKHIADNGLVQKEVAVKAGKSPVNFSKVLNHHSGSSPKYRKQICDAMGVSEIDMVRLGESERMPRVIPQAIAFPKPIPVDHMPADEVVHLLSTVSASLSTVSSSFIKTDARLKYWMQMFEALPLPVIVLRDSVVYSQNRKSRAIWDGIGKYLCDGCNDQACKDFGCDIKDALDRGRDIEKYKKIGTDYYKVQTSHFSANAHEYNIVIITPVNECLTISDNLAKINEERRFLASNPFECPEYYADADRRVSYVNDSFLQLFDLDREDLQTTDDFHIMLSRKLFYFQNVAKTADEVREFKKPAEITAKLKNNRTVHFMFRPHLKNGELAGVMVVVLTAEMHELFNAKKED